MKLLYRILGALNPFSQSAKRVPDKEEPNRMIVTLIKKGMPVSAVVTRVGDLDPSRFSPRFADVVKKIGPDALVNVKCYDNGELDLRGPSGEYRIVPPNALHARRLYRMKRKDVFAIRIPNDIEMSLIDSSRKGRFRVLGKADSLTVKQKYDIGKIIDSSTFGQFSLWEDYKDEAGLTDEYIIVYDSRKFGRMPDRMPSTNTGRRV